MPLREDVLNPIPGPNPAGADLRYDAIYDRIKEAKREDDDAPQGDWQHERKTADWPLVIKVSSEVLATKSKDLQLAAWLTEALLKREGYAGLRSGLGLLRSLIELFWDQLYPPLDPDDEYGPASVRAGALERVGLFEIPVKQVPLNKAGHDFFKYKESRGVGYEADASDEAKIEARGKAIAEGKMPAEEFDAAFAATPKPFYKALVGDIAGALETLQALDKTSEERFGSEAPNFARLRAALEEVQHAARQLLKRKLEADPDPIGAGADAPAPMPVTAAADVPPAQSAPIPGGALAAEPVSREDAASRVVGAARYLRRVEPRNPASYLMLRGFRWGELRAQGNAPDPRLLEAPPTHIRSQLKGLLLDRKWPELLELGETVMGTPQGRGWLDLQRYVTAACDGMGSDYYHVSAAIRGALRALLGDLPGLPGMTLMDDTPTANLETQAWLRDVVVPNGAEPVARVEHDGDGDSAYSPHGDAGALERAMADVRSGRPDRAIETLMRELAREKSRRGRFLKQTQLAEIMVTAGHEGVAKPILEELLALIESHKLEEWETGEVIAQPLALLYRCLEKVEGDPALKQSLYLRICRLDPVQAIGFAQA
jgi:type VI secretion system protein ImpA